MLLAESTGAGCRIYSTDGLELELRQGEVISGVDRYIVDPAAESYVAEINEFIVIVTQDCDLLQDYNQRKDGNVGSLCEVLVFPAAKAVDEWPRIKGSDIKKRINNNKDERYHLLERVPPELDLEGHGLPALLIDFKRFFTIPPEELFRQISNRTAVRRCRLEMPYREHFQSRAAFYFQRIMLPVQHNFDYEKEKT